ncbi:RICIN domain-containing protein [Actinomadura xylanilytica]|uniref:RICIN domain-containing protein n=1 Tax=Actinomadura xylanilytica TaxID=887459 RepID=UPI00255B311C|nr:RICIN domain-containing protein [Actinomadura xylanilytica]MDL4771520.1 RICIN domain-containing protein [Actinomadura xylanilytica]
MKRKQLALTLASAGAMLVGTASAAAAAPVAPAAPAAPAASSSATGGDAHVMITSFQYKSKQTGKCLDTRKDAGNAAVRQVDCHPRKHKDIRHQLWVLENDGTFRSSVNDKNCLTVYGTAAVVMRKCGAGKTQQWKWTGGATGKLKNPAKNKCLSTYPGSTYFRIDPCGTGGNKRVWKHV